ncbi:MAG: hypothetical protein ABSG09_02780, partial [Acidimicrobiales bacterium]
RDRRFARVRRLTQTIFIGSGVVSGLFVAYAASTAKPAVTVTIPSPTSTTTTTSTPGATTTTTTQTTPTSVPTTTTTTCYSTPSGHTTCN